MKDTFSEEHHSINNKSVPYYHLSIYIWCITNNISELLLTLISRNILLKEIYYFLISAMSFQIVLHTI